MKAKAASQRALMYLSPSFRQTELFDAHHGAAREASEDEGYRFPLPHPLNQSINP
jgi:hypothetical protein